MQTCAYCGEQNNDGAVSCSACGNPILAKFWKQWTREQRGKLEGSAPFLKALNANDIFAAQDAAISVLYPDRIVSPLARLTAIHPKPRTFDDPKQLRLKL